jgi:hypothetical protein
VKYENVFVLSPGRSGSKTFVEACAHITNYSSAHESRAAMLGENRFAYPISHIEADNRLTWFLGPLGDRFTNPKVLYINLIRDTDKTVDSFLHRLRNSQYRASIISAFAHGIVMKPGDWTAAEEAEVAKLYVSTVQSNINQFISTRNSLTVKLEDGGESFRRFLQEISAEGDEERILETWLQVHNAR